MSRRVIGNGISRTFPRTPLPACWRFLRLQVHSEIQAHSNARLPGLYDHLERLGNRPTPAALRPRRNLRLRVTASHRHDHTPNPYSKGAACPAN